VRVARGVLLLLAVLGGIAAAGDEERTSPEVQEVRIGYFGPSDPSHAVAGDMWRAARMAVEEANTGGGFRGKPFRLVAGWSKNPWGTGVTQVVRMAYTDGVRAILGGIDGPSTHLAEQAVAKARLVLISPCSTDRTANSANVPWMFSCAPGDPLLAGSLVAEVSARVGKEPFVVVSTDDHDARMFSAELMKRFTRRRMVPRHAFVCRKAAEDITDLVSRIVRAAPAAVVVAAGSADSARLVTALRGDGYAGILFGGPSLGHRRFLQKAGSAAEGVIFPLLYVPRGSADGFAKTFERRFGHAPDYAAAHTYDAARLLVEAVRKVGLDRARIRDAVRELSPWTGVTGTVRWDALGGNVRPVPLGTIRDGRLAPLGGATPPGGSAATTTPPPESGARSSP
jgi:ABC-type branched-subunit amino acid transport system substrate-binding protein